MGSGWGGGWTILNMNFNLPTDLTWPFLYMYVALHSMLPPMEVMMFYNLHYTQTLNQMHRAVGELLLVGDLRGRAIIASDLLTYFVHL